jgi:mono/diheme cytochrome c family protein
VIAGGLISCNYTRLKEPQGSENQNFGDLKPDEKLSMMNYVFINSRILQPKCVSCHGSSGDVNIESYDSIKSNLSKIQEAVFVTETMPKRGALTSEEKRLLWNWIRMGAPRESAEPPPEEEPMIATYESIRSHIIEPKCVTCHNPTGPGNKIPLDRQALLDSPLELVLPGNADESGLIIALERKDDKRMPPAKEGYSALKPEQIQIIREWINNGAN